MKEESAVLGKTSVADFFCFLMYSPTKTIKYANLKHCGIGERIRNK